MSKLYKAQSHVSFTQVGGSFTANSPRNDINPLPPGAYKLRVDQRGILWFESMNINHDKIIDLPSPEYDYIMDRINKFLNPATKATFVDYGFLYKWNCMLYGQFGTGKTCIVDRVAQKVIAAGGIIIVDPNPTRLAYALSILTDIQPDVLTMVIFEEFDEVIRDDEKTMLTLLDGEVQKNNIIYMATTNNIERIPARLKRPGRFATILEVMYPNAEARTAYLTVKLKAESHKEIPAWVAATEGLSIDELKETVLSVKCFGNTLEETVARIRTNKGLPTAVKNTHDDGLISSFPTFNLFDSDSDDDSESA